MASVWQTHDTAFVQLVFAVKNARQQTFSLVRGE